MNREVRARDLKLAAAEEEEEGEEVSRRRSRRIQQAERAPGNCRCP